MRRFAAAGRIRPSRVIVAAVGVAVLIFMAGPLVVLMVQSFSDRTDFQISVTTLTTTWYDRFFHDPELRSALRTSVEISGAVTALALAMGGVGALVFSHIQFRGKRMLELLIFLPAIVPWVLLGIAMNTVLAFFFPTTTSLWPVIVGQTALLMPFAFFITLMGARGVDPNLELAAVDLGASFPTTLRKVTLPLVVPWFFGAGLTVFSLSFNELTVTSLLLNQGSTLPLYVYSSLQVGITPEINAVAGVLVFSASVFGLLGVAVIWMRERSRKARPQDAVGRARAIRRPAVAATDGR